MKKGSLSPECERSFFPVNRICTLAEAMATVPDGAMLGLGGNTLNRAPMAAVYELIAQNRRNLRLVKTAGGLDIDLLCRAGCVSTVDAGFISCESEFGLAQHYRRAVQRGEVTAHEHACYTVISALRAASCGLPFMPVRGLQISDLRRVNDYFRDVTDPFSGEKIAAVRALAPDVSVLHVQEADAAGNARIWGPVYEDALLARASGRVIVTAERIVGDGYFAAQREKPQIPGFLVSHVVHAPRGAAPCCCPEEYGIDGEEIRRALAEGGEKG